MIKQHNSKRETKKMLHSGTKTLEKKLKPLDAENKKKEGKMKKSPPNEKEKHLAFTEFTEFT